jgi:SH3-like domain-containing protein
MRFPARLLGLAVAFAALTGVAHAIEFRSVGQSSILFDSPSDKGKRLFIIAAGTPVEAVVTLDKWVKVRDAGGALAWIERRALAEKRTVIVAVPRAAVRQSATDDGPVAFEAVKDVVLDFVSQSGDGWVQVRHKDGPAGYVKVNEVWGL